MYLTTKTSMTTLVLALAAASMATPPTVDGSKDASYGNALAVQTINTGFGNSTGGTGSSNGSELDAAYGQIQGGMLYLMFTGSLEANYNHLDLFIDTGAAGQNQISASTGNMAPFNGMTLSNGFNASQWFTVNGGFNQTPSDNHLYVNQSSYSGGTWNDNYLGATNYQGGSTLSGGSNPNGTQVAINDTSVSVQTGAAGTAISNTAPLLGVTTGIEFGISLADLGNPTGPIKIIADINGGGDSYLSNQFLGGLPGGTANLGAPGSVNLSQLGNPGFTVNPVPEPGSVAALGLGLAALLRKRARRA